MPDLSTQLATTKDPQRLRLLKLTVLSACNQTNPFGHFWPQSVYPVTLAPCWEFWDGQATSQGQLDAHSSQAHQYVFGLGAASLQTSLPLLFGDSANPWPRFKSPLFSYKQRPTKITSASMATKLSSILQRHY